MMKSWVRGKIDAAKSLPLVKIFQEELEDGFEMTDKNWNNMADELIAGNPVLTAIIFPVARKLPQAEKEMLSNLLISRYSLSYFPKAENIMRAWDKGRLPSQVIPLAQAVLDNQLLAETDKQSDFAFLVERFPKILTEDVVAELESGVAL